MATSETARRVKANSPAPGAVAVAQRRRGAALERAILAAAFAEVSHVGYAAFSVESVAARARTGKASIYRRWPTKAELVLDALDAELPSPRDIGLGPDCHIDESVTTEQALHRIGETIVRVLSSPAGAAMRAVKLEAVDDLKLADLIDQRFHEPRRAALLGILERGIARGEVRPDAATPVVADVLPAMLVHRMLLTNEPISADEVHNAISLVMIPLVQAHG
ncbi:TetR/AcrR family transcriptional regulator [uncultured Jatrophihabitans sp.]|uniref:TetR/AcrR family transcriptional regulator n=1 Tax=uncultured Jatrophihabitans sp. TaxID=1610747 RepID=UPI0035C94DF6